MFCAKCGKEIPEGAKFCDSCGTPVYIPAGPGGMEGARSAVLPPKVKKPRAARGKLWLILGCAAAAVVLIVLAVLLLPGRTDKPPLLYVTDGELVSCTNIKKNTTYTVDDEFVSDGTQQGYASFSKDNKRLLYMTDYDEEKQTYTLYWADASRLKGKDAGSALQKVSSGVTDYYVAGDFLVYMKNNKLYQFDYRGDPEQICKDAMYPVVSEDGSMICYLTDAEESEHGLYIYELSKKKAVKLDSGVAYIADADEKNSFQSILYTKSSADGSVSSLYICGAGKEKNKLASGIGSIYDCVAGAYAYYSKPSDSDMSGSLYRLNLRTGTESRLASFDDMNGLNTAYTDAENGILVYEYFEDEYDGSCSLFAAVGNGKVQKLDSGENIWMNCAYDSEAGTLYTVETAEGGNTGPLTAYPVGENGLGAGKKLKDDVFQNLLSYDGKLYYFLNFDSDDWTGTLYVLDGETKKLADDVDASWIYGISEHAIVYYRDVDDAVGTLCRFSGGEPEKISADVYQYAGVGRYGDDLLLLTDYDPDYGGTLCLYDGREKTKIADDVQLVILPS